MDVVTGAFSYSGSYIARRLLERGRRVRTLSRQPSPGHPLAARIETARLDFSDRAALADSLRGGRTLYNTYWIRFPHGETTFERAVENTRKLLRAAEEAGVRRIVHLSVTNPSEHSPYAYFRGKAALEREICDSRLTHAIVRPTLIFGSADILVNNIAWVLRRFPAFFVPGSGGYRVQPVAAEDMAELAVALAERDDDVTVDCAGPETYTFRELVDLVRAATGARARILRSSPSLALRLCGLVGCLRRDVLLTREELDALMDELLLSREPPLGTTSFRAWLGREGERLGRRYVSELQRNFRCAPL